MKWKCLFSSFHQQRFRVSSNNSWSDCTVRHIKSWATANQELEMRCILTPVKGARSLQRKTIELLKFVCKNHYVKILPTHVEKWQRTTKLQSLQNGIIARSVAKPKARGAAWGSELQHTGTACGIGPRLNGTIIKSQNWTNVSRPWRRKVCPGLTTIAYRIMGNLNAPKLISLNDQICEPSDNPKLTKHAKSDMRGLSAHAGELEIHNQILMNRKLTKRFPINTGRQMSRTTRSCIRDSRQSGMIRWL